MGRTHIAFAFAGLSKIASQSPAQIKPLIRFHNVRSDLELLQDDEEFNALLSSISHLKQQGGYLIFLNQQDKAHKSCGEIKDFGIGAQILKRLEVQDFILLSSCNTQASEYNALSGFNLHLIEKIEV